MVIHSGPTPDQPGFGRRLRALRAARGLSQAELAGTEVSPTYLSKLESGGRPPTARVVEYLCARLDVTPQAFAPGIGSPLARAVLRVSTADAPVDAQVMLESALDEDEDADQAVRWQALWMLARRYQESGDAAAELRVLGELSVLSDRMALPELQVRVRVRLARRQRACGELVSAYATASGALTVAEASGLPRRDLVEARLALASIEAESGRLVGAPVEAATLAALDGPDLPQGLRIELLWTVATVLARQGESASAAAAMERALSELASHEDPVLWMRLRLAAASLHLQTDPRNTQAARTRLDEARPAVELVGTPVHRLEFGLLSGQLALHEGRLDDAGEMAERLAGDVDGVDLRDRVRLRILRAQAAILRDRGREEAVADLRRTAQEAQEAGSPLLVAEVWRALAETLASVSRA